MSPVPKTLLGGRLRTSTVTLVLSFAAVLTLWILIRPEAGNVEVPVCGPQGCTIAKVPKKNIRDAEAVTSPTPTPAPTPAVQATPTPTPKKVKSTPTPTPVPVDPLAPTPTPTPGSGGLFGPAPTPTPTPPPAVPEPLTP